MWRRKPLVIAVLQALAEMQRYSVACSYYARSR